MIRIILIVILLLLIVRMLAISRKPARKGPDITFNNRSYKKKGISRSIGELTGYEEGSREER